MSIVVANGRLLLTEDDILQIFCIIAKQYEIILKYSPQNQSKTFSHFDCCSTVVLNLFTLCSLREKIALSKYHHAQTEHTVTEAYPFSYGQVTKEKCLFLKYGLFDVNFLPVTLYNVLII